MFDGRFRSSVDKGVGPIGTALGRTGLSPDHLTALGLLMAVPAALAIGTGRLALGLVLLIASAVPDLLDGALAKARGTASKRGAFFDSVADRVTVAIILGGVAWYLQSSRHAHESLLPFGILAVSTLISYERAKAESLGFTAKGGLMERAERIILLCAGLAFSVILVPILWVMLVLTAVTAVQRFVKVWRQATHAGAAESATGGSAPGDSGNGESAAGESGNGDVAQADGAAPAGGVAPAAGAAAQAGSGATGSVMPGSSRPVALGGATAGAPFAGGALTGAPLAGGGTGRGRAPVDLSGDPSAAMAERWRAWRQQTATARQGGSPMTPAGRSTGIGHEADGSRRSTRWEERRAARLRASSEAKSDSRAAGGRRHGTRRP